jgi:hypothetical protein
MLDASRVDAPNKLALFIEAQHIQSANLVSIARKPNSNDSLIRISNQDVRKGITLEVLIALEAVRTRPYITDQAPPGALRVRSRKAKYSTALRMSQKKSGQQK